MSQPHRRPRDLIERVRNHSAALRPVVKADNWMAIDLSASGWDNRAGHAPAGYQRRGGTVILRGVVEGGATGAVIVTLPPGLRPEFLLRLATVCAGPSTGWVGVDTDGAVNVVTGGASWISLDGLAFRAFG